MHLVRKGGALFGAFTFVVASTLFALPVSPASASSVQVNGAGSTWVAIALQAWAADVNARGLNINFNPVGSTSGRVFYYTDQVDFAASEIPFTPAYRDSTGTVITNEVQLAQHRPYAYMPDVAGGTSFMYHLNGINQQLNLTPDAVAKLFTGAITNWDDPEIAKSNPEVHLPNLAVRPVVRSDGSGTSAQFTAFMASQTPAVYQAFCKKVSLNPCLPTSLYPELPGQYAEVGSDGVANTVAATYENGAIGYVEYGYAKERGFPVASVLNHTGYYTQPSSFDVAVALQGATFNADGTQNLEGVYTFNGTDAKYAYPVSSYSYLIVPTTTASPMTAAKGGPMSEFILYAICAGQQKSAQLGYSPLPENLVKQAFGAIAKIPGHVAIPPLDQAHCDNPVIGTNWPLGAAPTGPPPSSAATLVAQARTAQNNNGRSGSGVTQTTVAANNPTGTTVPGQGTVDPGGRASGPGVQQVGTELASAQPVAIPRSNDDITPIVIAIVVLLLLAIVFAPPALAIYLAKRRANAPPA